MTSSQSCGAAWLMDGPTYDGLLLRTQHVAASFFNTSGAQVYGGVQVAGGQMAVSAGGGMSVNVATGYALCPSSSGSTGGGYLFSLMSAANLTVATSDPTNPRVDLVCAFANDLGTSSSNSFVEVLTGTPSAGASLANLSGAPSLPSNGIVLGYVLVPASSTSVTSGNISNRATLTTAQGGVLPVTVANAPTGYTGMYAHDPSTGRLYHNPAAGPVQAKTLPFTPQQARKTSTVSSATNPVTVASVTVTTDGNTDLEIHVKWPTITMAGSAGFFYASMQVQIDGSVVANAVAGSDTSAGFGGGGGYAHVTQSGVDRPSSGSHTVSFVMGPGGDGTHAVQIPAISLQPATLYVRPAPL